MNALKIGIAEDEIVYKDDGEEIKQECDEENVRG